jgi:predicted lipid-binding transport protein (Tim44 family)
MSMFDFISFLINGGPTRTITAWTSDDISPEAFAAAQAGAAAQDATASAPAAKPMWQQAKDQVAALKQVDPDFSETAFLEQAAQTFQTALAAEGDMNPAEAGDAATQAFRDDLAQRIAAWQSAGLVRHVTDVKIDPPMIFKAAVDGTQQQIMVRFTGSAVRYAAAAIGGSPTDAGHAPESFSLFATFVRPAGTTTPKSVNAGGPSYCPGCGAPMEPGAGVCPYCKTPLTATSATWQLDQIGASPYTLQ